MAGDLANDAIGQGVTRRQILGAAGFVLAAGLLPRIGFGQAATTPASTPADFRYKVSACDWIMLKRQSAGAITRAKECGCDGVETDAGPLGKNATFANKLLTDEAFRKTYLDTAAKNNIQISSIAMSGYYAQSFPTRPFEQPVKDVIETCRLMGVKTAFLPLGVQGDLVKFPDLRPAVVDRLKQCGEWAESAGVTIGIETSLDAAGEVKLLDDIGSAAIKSYFNFENPIRANLDICDELKILGKDRLVQIHATNEDKFWLQDDPAVDMPKVKTCLDDLGWGGWLVIERSRKAGMGKEVVKNFSANAAYLKRIFQP